MSKVSTKSPFKFLDSYGAGDQSIFFGRESEVDEVYDKVFQSKLLLVYGASGTGKSSIINCGLANKLDESDWMPISIRRGGHMRRSMVNQIQKEAIQKVQLENDEKLTNKGLERIVNSVYLDHFKPIYLIFDQFEELFIFGFKDEWKDFISAVQYLMETNLDVRFIFIIRGEYLEFLSEFEDMIPEFFDNRMRIEKMTRTKAKETISGPAKEYSLQMDDGFEEKLLKKLSPDKSQIELTFLQVFLDKLYRNAITNSEEAGKVQFTNEQVEELGQLGDVLAEFVDEQLFQMDDPKAALTILKSFVSMQGTKVQKSIEEVVAYCMDLGNTIAKNQVENITQSFVNKRILKDHDDNGKYELRHDSLAQKIFEKITNQEKELLDVKQFLSYSLNEYEKRGILLNDEDLSYISIYERNLELAPELRSFIELSKKRSSKRQRNRKTRIIIGIIMLVLFASSLLGFFYSQNQKARAEELAQIAQSEKIAAERQKSIAEEQREIALINEQRATDQAEEAEIQKSLADQARNDANIQRNQALKQKVIADNERQQAEKARIEAELSAVRALEQQAIADQQKSIALRLRTLAVSQGLATKSTFITDTQLKALLSMQALNFHKNNGGRSFDPNIYSALYEARKGLFGDQNLLIRHANTVSELIASSDYIYFISTNGQFRRLDNSTDELLYSSDQTFSAFSFTEEGSCAIGTESGSLLILDNQNLLVNELSKLHAGKITKVLTVGNSIITAGLDGIVNVLDGENVVETYELNEKINDLTYTADEYWMVSNRTLFKLADGQIRRFDLPLNTVANSVVLLPNTKSIAIGSTEGDIFIWDIGKEKVDQVLSGHVASITDLEVSQNGKYLGSSSFDRTVRIWPLDDNYGRPVVLEDHDNWVSDITFYDNKILTATYSGTIKQFELDMNLLANGLCNQIGRNLSEKEWNEFIGDQITYQKTCDE